MKRTLPGINATVLVAPYAGAWIETTGHIAEHNELAVAPYAGAWIETALWHRVASTFKSLPMRERGLKHHTQ